jgi:hypothetical protein
MTFREWLPITGRNRVALCLAGLSLVMFLGWNFWQVSFDGEPSGNGASNTWPEVISYRTYMYLRVGLDFEWLTIRCIFISLPLNAMVSVLLIPLWKVLHASPMIRVPLAMLCLAGGIATVCYLFLPPGFPAGSGWDWILSFMALSLLLNSAALLTFKNELALRDERSRL